MKFTKEGKKRHAEARARQVREKHPMWKGKIMREGYWYIFMPEHPCSGKQGYIAEHRLVMERKIGRYLSFEETVHHKNNIKTDNRIYNLELFSSRGEHTKKEHPEVIDQLRTINIGIRRSPKTEFVKGQKPWNFGKVFSIPKKCIIYDCIRSSHYKDGGRKGYCSMHRQRM